MLKVSVIIPVYNEQESIDWLVGELNAYFAKETKFAAEVIFINDGSTDRTLAKLKRAAYTAYACKIISLSKNFGSHAALRAGILQAKGDYITFMYADLQDPISLVGRMFQELEEQDVDVVWAFRNVTKAGRTEKLFSATYAFLMRRYAVPDFPLKGFDVVMFTRKVKDCLDRNMEGNSSVFMQILNFGFSHSTVLYAKRERKAGKSKWTFSKKIKLLIDSFVAFSFAPIRLVSIIGLLFFVAGIIWTTYIVLRKVLYNDLLVGWPAMISVLTIGFGITNISLGILAEYLWRTLDASRKRPLFIIDEEFAVVNEPKSEIVNTI